MLTPKSPAVDPRQYSVDDSIPFGLTKILYIRRTSGLSNDAEVNDITAQVSHDTSGVNTKFLDDAKAAAQKTSSTAAFTIERNSWLSTTHCIFDSDSRKLCTIVAPLLGFGRKQIAFPEGSSHSSHGLEMQPVGFGKGSEYFAKDSVLHFWKKESTKSRVVYRVEGKKKIKIGEYGAKHGYVNEGVLVFDEGQVGVVVALATCFAILTRSDSFTA
jgi:hypothetical protein